MALTYAVRGQTVVQDIHGEAQGNASVLVKAPDGSTAVLYTDRTKAHTAPNPTTADSLGQLAFYSDQDGVYELHVTTPIGTFTRFCEVELDAADTMTWAFIRQTRAEVGLTFPEVGAYGDGDHDDTTAIRNAIDMVEDGGVIVVPGSRTFLGVPDPTSLIVAPLDGSKGFAIRGTGQGATFKMADGTGNFVAFFGAVDKTTRLDGMRWENFRYDANLANSPLSGQADLQVQVGDWQTRRNGIMAAKGTGMVAQGITFIDAPRQGLMWPGDGPGDIVRGKVLHCSAITTVTSATGLTNGTPAADGDWDTTAILIRGDNCTIECLYVEGGAGFDYFISRTGFQLSGPGSKVIHVRANRYYRAGIVGNPGYNGLADGITVEDVVAEDANAWVEIQSLWWSGWTSGAGVSNLHFRGGSCATNKATYARPVSDGATPYALKIYQGLVPQISPPLDRGGLPIENMLLEPGPISNAAGYTGGGNPAVDWSVDNTVLTHGTSRNIHIRTGPVEYSAQNAVCVRGPNMIENLQIDVGPVLNVGQRAGSTDLQASVVRVGDGSGVGADLAVTGLAVKLGQVDDNRSPHQTSYEVYVRSDALTDGTVEPGTVTTVDGFDLPVVLEFNATSMVTVRGSRPFTRTVVGDKTLVLAHRFGILAVTAAATITVPPRSTAVPWRTGDWIEVQSRTASLVSLAGGGGVTLDNESNAFKLAGLYAAARLFYVGGDVWLVSGRTIP